jgi:acylphosphatase
MDTIAKHLKIRGRVQGVGFRQFMTRAALDLHVTGWVRNCADGCVEAVLSGPPDAVQLMIERARHGPSHAMVTGFEVTETHGSFTRFEVHSTE